MSIEEKIENILEENEKLFDYEPPFHAINNWQFSEVAKQISTLFPVWIPVSERLPDESFSGKKIFIINKGKVQQIRFMKSCKFIETVTHWTTKEEMKKIIP